MMDDLFSYDPETGEITRLVYRSHFRKGTIAGKIDTHGHRQITVNGKAYMAHRLAWYLHYGEWPEKHLDHINGDRDDNRVTNLRLASRSQNGRNRKLNKNNTSGIKGVIWDKRDRKWMVRVMHNCKSHYGGRFKNLYDAAKAVRELREKLHGEFCNHG